MRKKSFCRMNSCSRIYQNYTCSFFHTSMYCAAFLYLKFVNLNLVKKAFFKYALKLLLKLTTMPNYINMYTGSFYTPQNLWCSINFYFIMMYTWPLKPNSSIIYNQNFCPTFSCFKLFLVVQNCGKYVRRTTGETCTANWEKAQVILLANDKKVFGLLIINF